MDHYTEPINLHPCPSDYEPSDFFLDSVAGFLARAYMDKAQTIEKNFKVEFIRQWAWESERLQKEIGLDEELGEAMYFYGGHHRPSLVGMSTKISEVYRSGFLRALAWFYSIGKIPSDFFLHYSLSACPIDLTFWEIQTQLPPDWWPSLGASSTETIDTSISEAWQLLEYLVNHRGLSKSKDGRNILAAGGPVKPAEGWTSRRLNIEFMMMGFAYQVKGPNLPKPGKVGENLFYKSIWLPSPQASKGVCFFENEYLYPMDQEEFSVDDLVILPLVAHFKPNSINLWRWLSEYYNPMGLSYGSVSKGVILKHKHNGWIYTFKGKNIAFGYSWLSGIIERLDKDLSIPCGQVLEIDGNWLHNMLEHLKVKLGYVIKIKSYLKKYSYEEAKIFEDTKLFGISPIIRLS